MPYDRLLLQELKTTFVIKVSHLPGEIFSFLKKNKLLQENIFFYRKIYFLPEKYFPKGYLEFPTALKELPKEIINYNRI